MSLNFFQEWVLLRETFKLEFCTVSNNGPQKTCQKISVIKTNSVDWKLLTFVNIKRYVVHFSISIHNFVMITEIF